MAPPVGQGGRKTRGKMWDVAYSIWGVDCRRGGESPARRDEGKQRRKGEEIRRPWPTGGGGGCEKNQLVRGRKIHTRKNLQGKEGGRLTVTKVVGWLQW